MTQQRQTVYLEGCPYSDLKAFSLIIGMLPQDSCLHLSNSRPVRYAQLFKCPVPLTFMSNHGTSGIDGVVSTAAGFALTSPKINTVITGDLAFCSGVDQNLKGAGGYIGKDGIPRLNVLDVQKQIRSLPKPVIAMVNSFAIGGGHVLRVVCDLTIASENAIFGQTGPRVGSFDAGLGSSYPASIVGQKKAREIWFLCRQYSAQEALDMGMVNKVVPPDMPVDWAKTIMKHSPLALRMLKLGLNADLDGQIGLQEFAGNATLLYYLIEEAQEGKKPFWKKETLISKSIPSFPDPGSPKVRRTRSFDTLKERLEHTRFPFIIL